MLPGSRAWRIIKEMMKSRGGMFVARVPKFLNLSAAGHARLALPPAKIALVAASCLFAVVGVGAYVVALPGMSFSADTVVDGAAHEDARAADASEQPAEGVDVQEDAAATEAGEMDAQDGAAVSSAGASDSGAAAAASSSGVSAADGSAASPGSSSSGSGGSSSSGSSAGSGSSGSSASAAAPDPAPSQDDSTSADPFSAAPSAVDEQEFHAFLAGWYARLGACESEAAAGDASTCWSGYYAVRDYVRSNGSRWCGAQETSSARIAAWPGTRRAATRPTLRNTAATGPR